MNKNDGIDDHVEAIRDRLFDMSEEQFHKLLALIEGSRASGATEEFVDRTLHSMRARLRVARPPRRLTPQRLFCRPFEDLLYDGTAARTVAGRIARGSIKPCWTVVARALDPSLLAEMQKECAGVSTRDEVRIRALGTRFWPAAADAVFAVFRRSSEAALAAALGSEVLVAELRDMGGMVAIADQVEALRGVLAPAPIAVLDDRMKAKVVDALRAAAARDATHLGHLAHFVMARLSEPLDLVETLTAFAARNPQIASLVAVSRDAALADIEKQLDDARGSQDTLDDADIASTGVEMAKRLTRFRAAVKGEQDGRWAEGLDRVTSQLRSMVAEGVLEGAEGTILSTMSIAPAADGAATVAAPADEEAMIAAENRAFSLRKCETFAQDIGLAREVKDKIAAISREAERAAATLVEAVERGAVRNATIDSIEANLFNVVRMLELVAGPSKADAVRTKGMRALATAEPSPG